MSADALHRLRQHGLLLYYQTGGDPALVLACAHPSLDPAICRLTCAHDWAPPIALHPGPPPSRELLHGERLEMAPVPGGKLAWAGMDELTQVFREIWPERLMLLHEVPDWIAQEAGPALGQELGATIALKPYATGAIGKDRQQAFTLTARVNAGPRRRPVRADVWI